MECPHCNELGVSAWSKFMAGTALPAKCKLCGKPSSISGGILGSIAALFHFVFIVAAIVSFYYLSWWPLVIAFIAYVLLEICVVKWVPLKALTDAQVRNSKLFSFVFIVIFVLLVILAGITDA